MTIFRTVATVACAAFILGGCESTPDTTTQPDSTTSMGAVNERCPVMGGKVKTDAPTVAYKGETVGFCCAGCVQGWEKMSDDDKSRNLAGAK